MPRHFEKPYQKTWASLVAQLVKNPPAIQETLVRQEDPLEKAQATHSHILGLSQWLRWSRICLQCGRPGLIPWIGKILWRRTCNPLQYSCLENPHGQRSLASFSPQGHSELDMTERLSTAHKDRKGHSHRVLVGVMFGTRVFIKVKIMCISLLNFGICSI